MKSEELLSVLIQLSKVDSYFDAFELTYLLKVGKHIGLKDKLVERMIKHPTKKKISIPSSEQERMTVLYYMLFLMKVDKIINPEEEEMIHHYGFKLGFSKLMIDEFIEVIRKHSHRDLPSKALLNIINKYQN